MMDAVLTIPDSYTQLWFLTRESGFSMPSDLQTGSFLKTLAATKPGSRILELGTGTGLATSWILDGMDAQTKLITIDNNPKLVAIAKSQLQDQRTVFICTDAAQWIRAYNGEKFDIIFADAMPGKYELLDETLELLQPGGIYLIDDMLPQQNWPEGHEKKVQQLLNYLDEREDLVLTKMSWSTGLVMVTKKKRKS